jgi:hypothetical protein
VQSVIPNLFKWAGRSLGALSGAAVAVLWMLALWLPGSGEMLSGISFVVALLMALIALFVVIASLHGHSLVLVVAFVASFFPIGVHLAGVDHWLSWIGRLNLGYLVAGGLLWLARRAEARAQPSRM